jgi:hypothetical protein
LWLVVLVRKLTEYHFLVDVGLISGLVMVGADGDAVSMDPEENE